MPLSAEPDRRRDFERILILARQLFDSGGPAEQMALVAALSAAAGLVAPGPESASRLMEALRPLLADALGRLDAERN